MKLKCGRKEFEVNEHDVLLFNGCHWSLITQRDRIVNGYATPTLPKALCNKLLKENKIYMFRKEKEYITADGEQMGLYYYRFRREFIMERGAEE